MAYKFEYGDMEFSKDGQLDELIALDRYAVPTYDNYEVGDTVVAIVDKQMGSKKVGEIKKIDGDILQIKDRHGDLHEVEKDMTHKPLETKPAQLWSRWAKGAASVEGASLRQHWEDKFRKLVDGYGYSLGGRIQLMLGQEFVTGERANLTAYNCYVTESPQKKTGALNQFNEVLRIAYKEASIMRRGGGVGMNISHIKTVKGSGKGSSFFKFILPEYHKDYQELQDRKLLKKFDSVETHGSLDKIVKNDSYIEVGDSVDELFEALSKMVDLAYKSKSKEIVVDFSLLRHRGAIVKGVNGRSSGAVSWMELFALVAYLLQLEKIDNIDFAEIYSNITHLIEQGGSRRGALMLVCNIDNENVDKFIERKKDPKYLTGANISVGVDDGFMDKVKNGSKAESDRWNLIIQSAWTSAEPGIIFLERYNKESNSHYFHYIEATNPCGKMFAPR